MKKQVLLMKPVTQNPSLKTKKQAITVSDDCPSKFYNHFNFTKGEISSLIFLVFVLVTN